MPIIFAREKAESIAHKYENDIVIGFDTLVFHNGKVLGKPKNLKEAKHFLAELSGNYHEVITGCCLLANSLNISRTFADKSRIKFKHLTSQVIEEYLEKVNTLDKAGAYAIQEYGEMIVDHTEGSMDNIIGLPTEKLIETLKDLALYS